jgi:Flp pilus assembly protein TadG
MKTGFLKDQRGSASIEFVILAIPLFIPLFLYMNTFSSVSDDHERLRTLARESVRAFVTSANDEIAFEVSRSVIMEGGRLLGFKNPESEIRSQIMCSQDP